MTGRVPDAAIADMQRLEALARQVLISGDGDASSAWVTVRGRFVRRRKLSYVCSALGARRSALGGPPSLTVARLSRGSGSSKALVFGDIRLADGALLEVMLRAQDGDEAAAAADSDGSAALDADAIRDMNWRVKLGDVVTARGKLQRKQAALEAAIGESLGFLLRLQSMDVDERWTDSHSGAFLDAAACAKDPAASSSPQGASGAAALGSLVLAPASRAAAAPKYTNAVTIDGWAACKYYFSSAGGANCRRGAQCHFWHGDPAAFATNRQRWLAARAAQRAAASRIQGDDEREPHATADKAHRARILCEWLVSALGERRLREGSGVLDVAGGKGDIPVELWNQRGIPTTLMDPRPMKLSKRSRRLVEASRRAYGRDVCPQLPCRLDAQTIDEHGAFLRRCSLLVGMHPDEATEAIVDVALALRVPFAVVPCCVMSRTFPDRRGPGGERVDTYEALVRYLKHKHPRVESTFLPFAGRNQVLYLFDYGVDDDACASGGETVEADA